MAVLEWCKVFGSRGENTHWSTVVKDPDPFREGLLSYLDITHEQWTEYWEQMKNYRDLAVAHHTQSPKLTTYPVLDIALMVANYYYEFLVTALRELPEDPIYFLPKSLERYYQRLLQHAEQVAAAAYEASCEIEDNIK